MKVSSVVGGLVMAALALGQVGCAKRVEAEEERPPTDSAKISEYYPLAVGDSRTYAVNGRKDRLVEVKILKEEDGYFLDNQGGQLQVDSFGVRDQKRYLLRGPLEPGRTWTNVVSVSSTERYQILQVGVPCEAPAGHFQNCIRVEGRNRQDAQTTIVITWTFAPGVGLVSMEMESEQGGQRRRQTWLELTSYHLKPGQG